MWYEFSQNNSGGSFDVDEKICHRVFIQANSSEEADCKLEELGGYFNGCDLGLDCDCCGDRWYRSDEDDYINTFPTKNINSIEEYAQYLADNYGWTKPDVRLYYENGDVKEFFTETKK